MRLTNDRLGWGVVLFAAGVLVMVIVGRLQWAARFPGVLTESELARLAQIQINQIIIVGEITHTDSVLMTRNQYNALVGGYQVYPDPGDESYAVYVYRAYGNIQNAAIYGFGDEPDEGYQIVEIALDARSGISLGIVSAYSKESTPYDLHHLPPEANNPHPVLIPPTLAPYAPGKHRATPEKTAEAIP